jgi:hypothetical protein
MKTQRQISDFLKIKQEIEDHANSIASIMNRIDAELHRIADSVDSILFYEDSVVVNSSGYCRGAYNESIYIPIEYLSKSLEEVELLEKEELELRKKKAIKKAAQEKQSKEEKEYSTYLDLKQKFDK